ncbi:MAG: beta-galactosidase [Lacunisphaera sp.]|nr:beta-galactosidase [Lacunisphaera sp.]
MEKTSARTRKGYQQPHAVALLLIALAVSTHASPSASVIQPEVIATLDDFETLNFDQTASHDVKLSLVTEQGVTSGHKAARLEFAPREEADAVLLSKDGWNWSGRGGVNLAFDAYNPGKVSVQVFVLLVDDKGRQQSRSVAVPPGRPETYYAPLNGRVAYGQTGMRDTPPAWQTNEVKLSWRSGDRSMDISKVTKIIFRTYAQFEDKVVVIDNLRLRRDPPQDPDYLVGIVDRFGQTAKAEYPVKIHSEAELKAVAEREQKALAASIGVPNRSRFGGWAKGPKQKATGYFRVEKVDGKWWMIDPDGYLFFSSAIANVRMANLETVTGYDFGDPSVRVIDPEELTPEDSRDIVPVPAVSVGTRFLASPQRREMFEWLPAYDDPLGEHYGYRRVVHQGVLEHGEVYSFYKANLERRYGQTAPASYMDTWRKVTLDRMKDWGFTSFGNWIDPSFYDNQQLPYFANGWIIGQYKVIYSGMDYWSPLPDVYDPEFSRRARLTIEQIAREVKGSPWCIGLFVDNEKGWGSMASDHAHFGLVYYSLARTAAECPAKKAFTAILTAKYRDIVVLNKAWGTGFASWEAFAGGAAMDKLNDTARADFSALYHNYAETYFRIVRDEIKRVMPHHMYMGVRVAAEWGIPVELVKVAKQYTDVMSFNNYREGMHPDTWGFLKDLDFPTIIGEYHIGSTSDTGLYHPGLVIAIDQADRARMYEQYMSTVIDNPYMVGAHWFQYVDDPVTGRAYDGENYNVGWVTNTDIPYPEMVEAAKRVNYGLYERRAGK